MTHRSRLAVDQWRPSNRLVATTQAAYFVATGLWPLIDIRSFEYVTGPKTERWVVKTVGALVAVIGTTLGLAAWRRRLTPESETLAVGSALGLATVDVVYVARRRIRPVYLLDAIAELGLVVGWVLSHRRGAEHRRD